MIIEVLTDQQRTKEDSNDDTFFYSNPKLVNHLDGDFRAKLTSLYKDRLETDSIILDLMSSWNSHLPNDIEYSRVIGHGLNNVELEHNKRLDSFWVQDLNKKQSLPLDDISIDVCLIVASWQYLQYPEAIALEISRVVRPKGKIIVSFSNRAFWTKATRKWIESDDFQRLDYIIQVLESNGWKYEESIYENNNNNILSLLGVNNDPFFSVIASNK